MDLNGRLNVRQYFNVGGERYEFGIPQKQASHSCSICNGKFSTDLEVQKHILDTHSSIFNEHSCPACGENFDSENSLARHALEVHQVVLELECLNCDIFFPTQEELQKHNRAIHSDVSLNEEHPSTEASKVRVEYNYNLSPPVSSKEKHGKSGPDPDVIHCPHCRKTTNSVDELKRHINKVHPQKHDLPSINNLQCPHCRKKARTAKDLEEHIKESHSAQTCSNCGKVFGDEQELHVHEENDHGIVKRPRHTCEFCQRRFGSSDSINLHLNREHTNEADRKCIDCPITFDSTSDRHHFRDYHLVFTCDLCQAKINGQKAYKFHKESEHSVVENQVISCAHCPKAFSSRDSYTYHLITTHKVEMMYTCEVCGKAFKLRSSLAVHKELHIQLECDMCKKHFKGNYNFRAHLEIDHNIVQENNIRCAHCPRFFSNAKIYHMHVSSVHKLTKSVKCKVCGNSFSDKSNLNHHMKSHRKNIYFSSPTCSVCGQNYAGRGTRRQHLIAHCENDHDFPRVPIITCKFCPKYFSVKESYSLHVHTEHPGAQDECTLCPRRFSAEKGKLHQKAYEGIKCKECFNHYKCKYEFLIHLETVHQTVHSPKYSCPQCDMKFSCATTMRYHSIYTHNAIGDFDCDKCGLKFINKTMLKDHIMTCYNIATNEYKCAQCDATFLARFLLKRHEKTHIKPEGPAALLTCFCGRLFKRKALLDKHYLTHTDHCMTCEVCKKSFLYEKNLKKHMERHSGKQFMCGMCQKIFLTEHLLTKHMYRHIRGRSCEQCGKEHPREEPCGKKKKV